MFAHLVCRSMRVPALPVWRVVRFFLLIAWDSGAGKPGQGVQEGDTGGKAGKVGPEQRWELEFSGLLNACGDGRLLIQTDHLWEATQQRR